MSEVWSLFHWTMEFVRVKNVNYFLPFPLLPRLHNTLGNCFWATGLYVSQLVVVSFVIHSLRWCCEALNIKSMALERIESKSQTLICCRFNVFPQIIHYGFPGSSNDQSKARNVIITLTTVENIWNFDFELFWQNTLHFLWTNYWLLTFLRSAR